MKTVRLSCLCALIAWALPTLGDNLGSIPMTDGYKLDVDGTENDTTFFVRFRILPPRPTTNSVEVDASFRKELPQVWLLARNGAAIAAKQKPMQLRVGRSDAPVSILFGYPPSAATNAVAVVVQSEGQYHVFPVTSPKEK